MVLEPPQNKKWWSKTTPPRGVTPKIKNGGRRPPQGGNPPPEIKKFWLRTPPRGYPAQKKAERASGDKLRHIMRKNHKLNHKPDEQLTLKLNHKPNLQLNMKLRHNHKLNHKPNLSPKLIQKPEKCFAASEHVPDPET